ncbi:FAD binding domain-containing protein [Streptomyces sp. NPDC001076]
MKPPPFMYCDPETVGEVVALKSEYGADSLILAGGQSLLPLLAMRLVRPAVLIDINRIRELRRIGCRDDALEVGAGVRQYELEHEPLADALIPLLPEATARIGHVEVRHRGTVGGSLAYADPAAELPCIAVTLDATMVVRGPPGTRAVTARDFFRGRMRTDLGPEEVLIAVRWPVAPRGAGHGFAEVARRAGDLALAGAAAVVRLDESGRVTSVAVGVLGISETPVRADAVERALADEIPTPERVALAAQQIAPQVPAGDDPETDRAYRRHLASVVVRRAVGAAVARARERSDPR